MKRIVPALAVVLLSAAPLRAADASAVAAEAVEKIQAKKMELVATLVVLEGGEKVRFERLYQQYQDSLLPLNEQYAGLAWRLLEKSAAPSVEETQRLMREQRDLEVKKLDLREEFFKEFAGLLSPGQFVRLLQLENKADVMMKNEMAMQIGFKD